MAEKGLGDRDKRKETIGKDAIWLGQAGMLGTFGVFCVVFIVWW